MDQSKEITVEQHPLKPFLPCGAKVLLLGSFPPKRERWSMDFFYPNRQNDMWRVMGLIFYNDAHYFEIVEEKRFDREKIIAFCSERGIALYDTAAEIKRHKNNASDKFLEVVTPSDIHALLREIPDCKAIVTTGEKATTTLAEMFACEAPSVGGMTKICLADRTLHFWRIPSTSRAYPLALIKKAESYRHMFLAENFKLSK